MGGIYRGSRDKPNTQRRIMGVSNDIEAAESRKHSKTWLRWLSGSRLIAVAGLGISVWSIFNQYLFEKWKDSRSTPVLFARYSHESGYKMADIESFACPVTRCVFFNLSSEGFKREPVHKVLIHNASEETAALNVRIAIEVTCPVVIYGATCPACDEDEYSHSKLRGGGFFSSADGYRRLVLTFPSLDIASSREVLLGLASRETDQCPDGEDRNVIRVRITADHNGHYLGTFNR
jgi:hypothetical protein